MGRDWPLARTHTKWLTVTTPRHSRTTAPIASHPPPIPLPPRPEGFLPLRTRPLHLLESKEKEPRSYPSASTPPPPVSTFSSGGSRHSGSATSRSARLGPRRFFARSARGFLLPASPTSTLVLARSPSSAFTVSKSASFSEFLPTRLSAARRSCSAPSLPVRSRFFPFVVLPVFTFLLSVLDTCCPSAIFPPFPATAPRTLAPAEKEHVRQSRSGIA